MTIDENIFYNFTDDIKRLKFVIKFQLEIPKFNLYLLIFFI